MSFVVKLGFNTLHKAFNKNIVQIIGREDYEKDYFENELD